ncbi:MAG: GAF domain-containing protein [Acidobacteriaceae bacterium]
MSAPAASLTPLQPLQALSKHQVFRPEQVCAALAKIFSVDVSEVGLLRLEGRTLSFLFPLELRTSGFIPLSSSALAAETAQTMKAKFFNNFARVRHDSIFEVVASGVKVNSALRTIQKLMSAPIMRDGYCMGVIQVCRKGFNPEAAGSDFDAEQLARLELAGVQVGKLLHEQKMSPSALESGIIVF